MSINNPNTNFFGNFKKKTASKLVNENLITDNILSPSLSTKRKFIDESQSVLFSPSSRQKKNSEINDDLDTSSDEHLFLEESSQESNEKIDTTSSAYVAISDYPVGLSPEKWNQKVKDYPWLILNKGKIGCSFCRDCQSIIEIAKKGQHLSKEWQKCKIVYDRRSLFTHKNSRAHEYAANAFLIKKQNPIVNLVDKLNEDNFESTKRVFRTSYHIAKSNRPYKDQEKLVELQKLNGLDMGQSLYSKNSCQKINQSISDQMRSKLCKKLISINSLISIIIDESTTMSTKTTLMIYFKAEFQKDLDPAFFFMGLIELCDKSAESIVNDLLNYVQKHGFDDKYLKKYFVAFAAGGASAMFGCLSGVATLLKNMYPRIVIWHCLNHRLELSVSDTIENMKSINHFESFMGKLYTSFSRSSKNQGQLRAQAAKLETEILKIGKILTFYNFFKKSTCNFTQFTIIYKISRKF